MRRCVDVRALAHVAVLLVNGRVCICMRTIIFALPCVSLLCGLCCCGDGGDLEIDVTVCSVALATDVVLGPLVRMVAVSPLNHSLHVASPPSSSC